MIKESFMLLKTGLMLFCFLLIRCTVPQITDRVEPRLHGFMSTVGEEIRNTEDSLSIIDGIYTTGFIPPIGKNVLELIDSTNRYIYYERDSMFQSKGRFGRLENGELWLKTDTAGYEGDTSIINGDTLIVIFAINLDNDTIQIIDSNKVMFRKCTFRRIEF